MNDLLQKIKECRITKNVSRAGNINFEAWAKCNFKTFDIIKDLEPKLIGYNVIYNLDGDRLLPYDRKLPICGFIDEKYESKTKCVFNVKIDESDNFILRVWGFNHKQQINSYQEVAVEDYEDAICYALA